jgi:hypothetical protein
MAISLQEAVKANHPAARAEALAHPPLASAAAPCIPPPSASRALIKMGQRIAVVRACITHLVRDLRSGPILQLYWPPFRATFLSFALAITLGIF